MSLPNWVSIERDPSREWSLEDSWWVEDASTNVFILAFNEDGTPAFNARALQLNGGSTPLSFKQNDAGQAQADFKQSDGSIFYPDRGEIGPYSAMMDHNSDLVHGMGLPAGRHFEYWLVFKHHSGVKPPPNGDVLARVAAALRHAADELEQ